AMSDTPLQTVPARGHPGAALLAVPRELRRPIGFSMLVDPRPSGATRARMANRAHEQEKKPRATCRGAAARWVHVHGSVTPGPSSNSRSGSHLPDALARCSRTERARAPFSGRSPVIEHGLKREGGGVPRRDRLERRVAHRSAARSPGLAATV